MEICLLQSDKEPFYMKKLTKMVKDKIEAERVLQEMLTEGKLELETLCWLTKIIR